MTPFIFVIDTDKEADDFDREICAFITGEIGECGVGSDNVDDAETALSKEHREWFRMHSTQEADERGCFHPSQVQITPGKFQTPKRPACLSVGLLFDQRPPADIIEVMKTRARAFDPKITVTGFRLLYQELKVTSEIL